MLGGQKYLNTVYRSKPVLVLLHSDKPGGVTVLFRCRCDCITVIYLSFRILFHVIMIVICTMCLYLFFLEHFLQWEHYLSCDENPDPTVLREINTFMSLWREDQNKDIKRVMEKGEQVLNVSDKMVFFSLSLSEHILKSLLPLPFFLFLHEPEILLQFLHYF